MRDDFLFHCHAYESLAPIFSELTAARPAGGRALRRALVQPALKCGYRFEDESLVEEMLAEVAGERGALPLLAFAMSRLWDRRDRERGLLTRAAYEEIGGVAGALAQHAEATLDASGRNACRWCASCSATWSPPTRGGSDREELLSVFARQRPAGGQRGRGGARRARRRAPADVYERAGAEGEPRAGAGSRSFTSRC